MTQRVLIALGGLVAAGVLAFGLVAVGFGPSDPLSDQPVIPAAPEAAVDLGTIGVDPTPATITDEVTRSLAESGLELTDVGFDVSASQGESLDSGVGAASRSSR